LWNPGSREVINPKTIIWISFTMPHHWLPPLPLPASGTFSFSIARSAPLAGWFSMEASG